jgi:hypothetical protein
VTGPVGVLAGFIAFYRDTWDVEHVVRIEAVSREASMDALQAWKGSANISFISVEADPAYGLYPEPHADDDRIEFPAGEFPPQANVGPLA